MGGSGGAAGVRPCKVCSTEPGWLSAARAVRRHRGHQVVLVSTASLGLASSIPLPGAKIRAVLSTTQFLTAKQEMKKMLGEVSRAGALCRKLQAGITGLA